MSTNLNKLNSLGTYKISFPDGEFYLGGAYGKKGLIGRWHKHKNHDKSSPKYLQEKAKEYGDWFIDGEDNPSILFEILEYAENKNDALEKEQSWILKYWETADNKNELLLNKRRIILEPPNNIGTNHPQYGIPKTELTKKRIGEANKGKKRSKEAKQKMSESRKKEKNAFFGKHHSEETKQKIREKALGRKHSEKAKQKMSDSRKGEKHPLFGKHMSEESRKKMSEAWSEERKENLIKRNKENNPMSREENVLRGENNPMSKITDEIAKKSKKC